jgi:hypothetical protein
MFPPRKQKPIVILGVFVLEPKSDLNRKAGLEGLKSLPIRQDAKSVTLRNVTPQLV